MEGETTMRSVSASPSDGLRGRASVLAQLDRGISVARSRLEQLRSAPIDAFPDAPLVLRAGGRALATLEADLERSRSELERVLAELDRPIPRMLGSLPALRTLLGYPDAVVAEEALARALATRDAAMARARRRAAEYLRDLRSRERADAMRKVAIALRRFVDLRQRLAVYEGEIEGLASPTLSPPWLLEVERAISRPIPKGEVPRTAWEVREGPGPDALSQDRAVLENGLRSRFAPFAHPVSGAMPTDSRWTVATWARAAGAVGIRLTGEPDLPAPEGLGAIRIRNAFPALAKGSGRLERCYLPVPPEVAAASASAGARIGKRGSASVDLSAVDPSGPIASTLPFVAARRYVALPSEPVPSSSWGGNLNNLLAPASWARIRRGVVGRFGGLCQVCGELRQGQQIECHEVWDYQAAEPGNPFRVQRLAALLSVCRPCHRAFHIGLGRGAGPGEEAIVRLADVNGWSLKETHVYLDWAQACWELRSEWKWELDLGLLAGEQIVVDAKRWRLDGEGALSRVSLADAAEPTRVSGARWRLGPDGEVIGG